MHSHLALIPVRYPPTAESTTYHFSVRHEHLEEAVDRFAQFFVSPLMTPSATEREVNAVDAENAKNLQLDERRDLQMRKALCDPAHVWAKFGTGSKHTLSTVPAQLGVDVRQVGRPQAGALARSGDLESRAAAGSAGPLRGVLLGVHHDLCRAGARAA